MNSLDAIWREYIGYSIKSDGGMGFFRTPEGAWSAPHMIFVISILVLTIALAVFLGLRNRDKDTKTKCRVLLICAIIIDGVELIKIITNCIYDHPTRWLQDLPLYLCSIQFITIPIAALSKGRLKEAALDFVLLFGLLGGVLGTVGATQNYNEYPVWSMRNVTSGITHSGAAFASIYIAVSGLSSMKKKNIWITLAILFAFCLAAFAVNECPWILNKEGLPLDSNYMFLKRHDGTPYVIVHDIVGGSPVLYPIMVVMLFVIYIFLFHFVLDLIRNHNRDKNNSSNDSVSL